MKGRKPRPKSRHAPDVPAVRDGLPRCPPHLTHVARKEWRRLATPLYEVGVLTLADRAALAAYCQAWARWVEAEEKLAETPVLIRTPSGYAQQSPWLTIANKQLELMGRYMAELGLTPVSRSRVAAADGKAGQAPDEMTIRFVSVFEGADGQINEREIADPSTGKQTRARVLELDPRL